MQYKVWRKEEGLWEPTLIIGIKEGEAFCRVHDSSNMLIDLGYFICVREAWFDKEWKILARHLDSLMSIILYDSRPDGDNPSNKLLQEKGLKF